MGEPEAPAPPPPRLRLHRGRALVWEVAAARELRERHRVWGALVGTPPRGARGRRERLPLQLLPEELRLLLDTGAAALEQPEAAEGQPRDPPTPNGSLAAAPERRFRVYRELWGRGLHLTPGGKFGGDFLVYPGPPGRFHAAAVASCPAWGEGQPLPGLVAAARLGTSVRKTLLLAGEGPGGGAGEGPGGGAGEGPGGGGAVFTSLQWRADL